MEVDLYCAAALLSGIDARTANSNAAGALITARQALTLLEDGGVLSDIPDSGWAEPARMHHTVLLRRARHAVAEAALRCGQTATAREVAEAAAERELIHSANITRARRELLARLEAASTRRPLDSRTP